VESLLGKIPTRVNLVRRGVPYVRSMRNLSNICSLDVTLQEVYGINAEIG